MREQRLSRLLGWFSIGFGLAEVLAPRKVGNEVVEFVRFYLSDEGQQLVSKAHCINLGAERLKEQRNKFEQALGSTSMAAAKSSR